LQKTQKEHGIKLKKQQAYYSEIKSEQFANHYGENWGLITLMGAMYRITFGIIANYFAKSERRT
jgi:hypothetical protein